MAKSYKFISLNINGMERLESDTAHLFAIKLLGRRFQQYSHFILVGEGYAQTVHPINLAYCSGHVGDMETAAEKIAKYIGVIPMEEPS